MTQERMPAEAERYLRRLEDELADAPADIRQAIADDVRAHIADAVAEGRPLADVLKALGTVRYVAHQYREELALPADAPDPAGTAARVLQLAAVVVGVATAVFVAFLLPSIASVTSVSDSGGTVVTENPAATIAQQYGLGIAAVTFLPALLAALPLLLIRPARQPVAIADAVIVTVFAVVSGFSIGAFYLPLALLMWATVVVPWRVRRGFTLAGSVLWRAVGGVLVAVPGLLAASATISGALQPTWATVAAPIIAVALGVLFGFGFRFAYAAIAVVGAVLMVFTMIDPRALLTAAWWFGGGYLAIGLSALVASGQKGRRRAEPV